MKKTHQSVERALEILLSFSPYNREINGTEIGKNLGLHPSTVNRLLHVISGYGFLRQDPVTKKFRLGQSVAQLGRAMTQSYRERIVEIAKPEIDALRDVIGDTISLELMLDDATTVAYRARGPHRIQVLFDPGERFPIHVAVGARAILAFSAPEVVDRFIQGKLTRFTRYTITDPDLLRAELKKIRNRGYSFDNKELDVHIQAVAAPVFDHEKKPVAAVLLAAPVFRMKVHLKTNAIAQVQETAKKISDLISADQQLGGSGETSGVGKKR